MSRRFDFADTALAFGRVRSGLAPAAVVQRRIAGESAGQGVPGAGCVGGNSRRTRDAGGVAGAFVAARYATQLRRERKHYRQQAATNSWRHQRGVEVYRDDSTERLSLHREGGMHQPTGDERGGRRGSATEGIRLELCGNAGIFTVRPRQNMVYRERDRPSDGGYLVWRGDYIVLPPIRST